MTSPVRRRRAPFADETARQQPDETLLLVKHGFSTAAWEPPVRGTEVERIYSAEPMSLAFRGRWRVEPAQTVELSWNPQFRPHIPA